MGGAVTARTGASARRRGGGVSPLTVAMSTGRAVLARHSPTQLGPMLSCGRSWTAHDGLGVVWNSPRGQPYGLLVPQQV